MKIPSGCFSPEVGQQVLNTILRLSSRIRRTRRSCRSNDFERPLRNLLIELYKVVYIKCLIIDFTSFLNIILFEKLFTQRPNVDTEM